MRLAVLIVALSSVAAMSESSTDNDQALAPVLAEARPAGTIAMACNNSLPVLEFGNVTTNGTNEGAEATVTCNAGYYLSSRAPTSLICQSSGIWLGLKKTTLIGRILNLTTLNGTSLNGTNLNGTSLNGTNLNGTTLNETIVYKTALNGNACIQAVAPAITWTSPSAKVNENDNVKLSCEATGMPAPGITWFSVGTQDMTQLRDGVLTTTHDNTSVSTITLVNVTTDDGGSYGCQATNYVNMSDIVTMELQVYTIPTVLNNFLDITAMEGGDIVLYCNVTSTPMATITWFHDGELIQTSARTSRYHWTDQRQKLTVSQITFDDKGDYSCNARNQQGNFGGNDTFDISHVTVVGASASDAERSRLIVIIGGAAGGALVLGVVVMLLVVRRKKHKEGAFEVSENGGDKNNQATIPWMEADEENGVPTEQTAMARAPLSPMQASQLSASARGSCGGGETGTPTSCSHLIPSRFPSGTDSAGRQEEDVYDNIDGVNDKSKPLPAPRKSTVGGSSSHVQCEDLHAKACQALAATPEAQHSTDEHIDFYDSVPTPVGNQPDQQAVASTDNGCDEDIYEMEPSALQAVAARSTDSSNPKERSAAATQPVFLHGGGTEEEENVYNSTEEDNESRPAAHDRVPSATTIVPVGEEYETLADVIASLSTSRPGHAQVTHGARPAAAELSLQARHSTQTVPDTSNSCPDGEVYLVEGGAGQEEEEQGDEIEEDIYE